MKLLRRILMLILSVSLASQADQPLKDFVCVVVAEDALPVQKAAAEEHLAAAEGKAPVGIYQDRLLQHRDWAGPDEGLYAFTNDRGLRQWHTAVKAALGIEKETALT